MTVFTSEPAAHGVIVDPSSRLAYVTRSEANTVDVFNPATMQSVKRIPVADDPDGIFYDALNKLVYVAAGDAKLATLIDPVTQTTIGTIPLGGKAEFAAFDAATKLLYQNLKDLNSGAAVDIAKRSAVQRWVLSGCEGPAGMAIDEPDCRLFIVCSGNSTLAVFDLHGHRVIATFPIGGTPDSIAFDAALHRLYMLPIGTWTSYLIPHRPSGIVTAWDEERSSSGLVVQATGLPPSFLQCCVCARSFPRVSCSRRSMADSISFCAIRMRQAPCTTMAERVIRDIIILIPIPPAPMRKVPGQRRFRHFRHSPRCRSRVCRRYRPGVRRPTLGSDPAANSLPADPRTSPDSVQRSLHIIRPTQEAGRERSPLSLRLYSCETMNSSVTFRSGLITPLTRGLVCRFASRAAPVLIIAPIAVLIPHLAEACASCGCTLSSDAAMGYSSTAGWRLNVEYDYIHQDQLRSGTRRVSAVPDGTELERETLSRYITTGLSYSPNSAWNLNLLVPYVVRTHSTYGAFDSTQPLPQLSSSRSSSLGDIRLIGSYQGLLPTSNLGLQLGVKLPTGHYGTAVDFSGGPNAGTPLDASLQPGTGSTDVIVGAYYYQAVSQNFDIFANGQFQSAVKHHLEQPGNDYRPGNSTTVSFGLRYEKSAQWVPQLQLNLLHKSRDRGALADVQSTAGNVAYISPGLTATVLSRLQVFGFVQVPVYSNLYGFQLFPRYTFSVGASYGL